MEPTGTCRLAISFLTLFAYAWMRRGLPRQKVGPSTEDDEMGVSVDDRAFYERRLREELARSTAEPCAKVRLVHRQAASLYRERLAHLLSGKAREVDTAL